MRIWLLLWVALAGACGSGSKSPAGGAGEAGTSGTSGATGGSGGTGTGGTGTGGRAAVGTGTGGTGGMGAGGAGTGGAGGTGGMGTGGMGIGGAGTGGMGTGGMGTGGTSDPCASVANACPVQGVKCNGKLLVTCAKDADGCLVETTADCAKNATDYCDSAGAIPVCAACADLPHTCASAAKSCDAETLVTCAEDAHGCLVETRTDCATVSGKPHCSDTIATPACVDPCLNSNGNPKPGVCATDAATCSGDTLVQCIKDSDGCPIATRTNCKSGGTNYCNASVQPPVCASNSCLGVTNCLTAGTTCGSATQKVVCAPTPDAAMCLVETRTDCTTTANKACGEVLGMSGVFDCIACVSAAGCSAAGKSCDVASNSVWTCTDTDPGVGLCLARTDEACGSQFTCTDNTTTAHCQYSGSDVCDQLAAPVLREAGDYPAVGVYTTVGGTSHYGPYTACPEIVPGFPVVAAGPDQLFAVDVAPHSVVIVSLKNQTGFDANAAPSIALLTSCSGTSPQAEASCKAISVTNIKYTNTGNTTTRVYAVVDADGATNDGTFTLNVVTRPLSCGDGFRDGAEACDDGNIFSKDGCTPNCTLETGYVCTAANPSVCTQRPTNNTCGNVTCPALTNPPTGTVTCCTAGSEPKCGVAYSAAYGASCFERDQPAMSGGAHGCPNEDSILSVLWPSLQGCCRTDHKCGLTAAVGAGCVERAEVWTALQDGPGAFWYGPPPAAPISMSCN